MQDLRIKPEALNYSEVEGVHVNGTCPHCSDKSNFTRILSLNENQLNGLKKIGSKPNFSSVWVCNGCNGFVYVEYEILQLLSRGDTSLRNPRVINRQKLFFDYAFVPDNVANDLKEACNCFSVGSFNGFAAMCRRAVETLCEDKGAGEKSRLKDKVKELKGLVGIKNGSEDEELLDSVVLIGHDGAHSYLPKVDKRRAELLFQFMSDIVEQMYNRQGRIKEAQKARQEEIELMKQPS